MTLIVPLIECNSAPTRQWIDMNVPFLDEIDALNAAGVDFVTVEGQGEQK
jgi:hypothetical protein